MMQLISRYAIASAAYPADEVPYKVSARSVRGEPKHRVLHLVPVLPAADPEGVERRDVGLRLGVLTGGEPLRPAVPGVEVDEEDGARAAGLGDHGGERSGVTEVATLEQRVDLGLVEPDTDHVALAAHLDDVGPWT